MELDDSDDRPGAKFYRWELQGVPIRIEIGPRDMERGVATLVRRDGKKITVPQGEIVTTILVQADDLQKVLAGKAQEFMESKIKDCSSVEEARDQTKNGVARVAWCGSEECGHAIEDDVGASMLGEPWGDDANYKGNCLVCGKETKRCALMAKQY